ncbi:hypothetical protein EOA27_32435 [Mesorhizobium sp. M2A.F.Ca.ET.037.01.1.1]|nr:hypothetical protein EJ072_35155 [Mesorhizobium sp. M2A.F.Ca.ET.046.03.2.1]RUX02209.1 hypothetical protein EOA27_32435 [Mesorhizobium sp. M2A.F.Ca.ET.037.01.1.1]RUY04704.1 hypothetical protein EOA25_18255 [Mesorhizobium sp. M2A.F.Ca.ET.040.01.1.1]RVC65707.1 hypothetical protein EN759_21270 [Mesorhizobium sp. M00.F.Ca.ET.038.03.1.1]RVC73605.1 hypothetical protein EN766_20435 [Mesorhizobium sp. M2A.F.Ca.ET.046.02.1.1]RWA82369.1 MAG: hypothetical protein EOQ31_30115 [Mesorhizobium sp.]RWX6565
MVKTADSSRGRRDSAPLCPTGHLPHLGGDQPSRGLSPIANAGGKAPARELPISPVVGEMSGRTEGGEGTRPFQQSNNR